jgi:uncharacterized protein (DUF1499 family)
MALFSIRGRRPTGIGVRGSQLAPCPASPNCVCSDESDAQHAISAFSLAVPAALAWAAARQAVLALPRTEIVSEQPEYLHAECASALFGFVDDVELHLRPQAGVIGVRSASRVGYSDFGVNRRRVEAIRAALVSRGVLR